MNSTEEAEIITSAQENQAHQSWANKYKYQEFDPYSPGERMLKDILRAILPQALFLTWEVLAQENQAPGNDAYLGVTKLAQARKRTDRKVRMDLDDLQGRQLLTIRHEWKIFRQDDGTMKARPVAIKDFERLYDLAYEYLCWTRSDCYIPPEREFVDFIRENEPFMRKLMRFDIYRRLLCNKKPGRETQEREIHQWYRNYDGDVPPLPSQAGQAQERVEGVQAVAGDATESIRKESLQESLQESLKKASTERIESIDNQNELKGELFDSPASLEERGGANADYTKPTLPNEAVSHEETPSTPITTPTIQTTITKLPPFASGKGRAAARQQADLDPRIAAFVERAMSAPLTEKGASLPPIVKKKARGAAPNPLIEHFVRFASPILHDENKEASVTRSLRAVERKGLCQMDILACLVMAYVVARDTKVKEKYRRPTGDLRMPLFCTMFERFAGQRAQGEFDYSEENLQAYIEADENLMTFVRQCGPEEMHAPAQASNANGKPLTTTPTAESSTLGAAAPRSGSGDMSQADAEALVGEILQEREKLGVIDAVPQGKDGKYMVVVTTRMRSMPMCIQKVETWRNICHIVEREHQHATVQ